MSAFHTISIGLPIQSDGKKIIQDICTKAINLGFNIFDNTSNSRISALSTESIINIFNNPTEEELEDGGPTLPVVYQDEHFLFNIMKYDEGIFISIYPSANMWKKEFGKENTSIDFARYLELLMNITHPYNIINIDVDAL